MTGPRVAWRTTGAPAIEPVTLSEVKAALGIEPADTTRDALLARLITAAREAAEAYTGRAFITQTITLLLDDFPGRRVGGAWWDGVRQAARSDLESRQAAPIYLPRPPLQSITSVAFIDVDGTPAAIDPLELIVDTISEPGRIMTPPTAWPATRGSAAVTIVYKAGYGSNAADVPGAVAAAILAHVTDAYQRPSGSVVSESIDNASVTYGTTGADAAGGAFAGTGLRGGAAEMLAPLRIRDAGALTSTYALP